MFNTAPLYAIIIPLAIIAVLSIIILVIFLYLRGKVRRFSREAFGTDDFVKAAKDIERSSESARAIHGMTDIYLPMIKKDFPEFDYEVFEGRVEGVIKSYLAAITARDLSKLTPDCSDSLKNTTLGIIRGLEANDHIREYSDITIHQTEIARYDKNGATVTILFNSAVGHYDVTRDGSGRTVAGSAEKKRQTVYDVALVYAQDVRKMSSFNATAMGVNCPNCGAPITNLGQKFCEYCGTGVREINVRSWSFESIKEEKVTSKPY